MTTPDDETRHTAREELAQQAAELFAELTAYADGPDIPVRVRVIARTLASIHADTAAWAASADVRLAEQERKTAEFETLMYGEDLSFVAGILHSRLGPRIAELITLLQDRLPGTAES